MTRLISKKQSRRAHVDASLIAAPEDLGRTISKHLAAPGFVPRMLAPEGGDVFPVIEERLEQAARLHAGEARVIHHEPTLLLPEARGKGGRADDVLVRLQ